MENTIIAAQNRKLVIDIQVLDGTEPYILSGTEKLKFGVKKEPSDDNCVIQAELEASDYHAETQCYTLNISSDDMDIPAGMYFYDIALVGQDGQLSLVIGCEQFVVADSVIRGRVSS